jgi:hypothetical protein
MTLDEMIRCAGRELGLRRAVYPKWVAQKRMDQADADFEIACMDAIYSYLKAAKESSPPPQSASPDGVSLPSPNGAGGGAGPESAAAQGNGSTGGDAGPESPPAPAAAPTDAELIADIEKRVKRRDFDSAFDLARGIQDQDLNTKTVARINKALAFVAAKAVAK